MSVATQSARTHTAAPRFDDRQPTTIRAGSTVADPFSALYQNSAIAVRPTREEELRAVSAKIERTRGLDRRCAIEPIDASQIRAASRRGSLRPRWPTLRLPVSLQPAERLGDAGAVSTIGLGAISDMAFLNMFLGPAHCARRVVE